MVYKKVGGFFWNGCDFELKCFGVKVYGGQVINVGGIIVCQCGMCMYVGENVGMGKDYILFVLVDGYVKFVMKGVDKKYLVIVVLVVV